MWGFGKYNETFEKRSLKYEQKRRISKTDTKEVVMITIKNGYQCHLGMES